MSSFEVSNSCCHPFKVLISQHTWWKNENLEPPTWPHSPSRQAGRCGGGSWARPSAVMWAFAVTCQVAGETTHRISWHRRRGSSERKQRGGRCQDVSWVFTRTRTCTRTHTAEHVFGVSRFLLGGSVLLFADKSPDLSRLPHFFPPLALPLYCSALVL